MSRLTFPYPGDLQVARRVVQGTPGVVARGMVGTGYSAIIALHVAPHRTRPTEGEAWQTGVRLLHDVAEALTAQGMPMTRRGDTYMLWLEVDEDVDPYRHGECLD